MRNQNWIKKSTGEDKLLPLWRKMSREGAEFFVDGEVTPLKTAVQKMVEENNSYMADYILGEKGWVKEIHLDKVEED